MELGWWKETVPSELHPIYEDFGVFLHLVWEHLRLPPPTVTQRDIATALQNEELKRLIIMAFRGVGKSWITSAFTCWCGLRDPQVKVLVVSASKSHADNFSTFTLKLIEEIELLQHLRPRTDQRFSKIAFDFGPARNALAPSVKSAGIFGQITGSRADIIIADDIETPNTSETQGMRDKLAERSREFSAILKPGGRIIYLGTPQSEDSLYNKLEQDRGYTIMVWPARIPEPADLPSYHDRLAPRVVGMIERGARAGTPVDPERFDDHDLLVRKAEYGSSGFALQFMLSTRLSDEDRYPLRLRDLLFMDLDPDLAPEKILWANDNRYIVPRSEGFMVGLDGDRFLSPMDFGRDDQGMVRRRAYTGRAMFIDPSGRGKDETAWCILYSVNGYIFLMDQGGMRDGYGDETLKALVRKAKEWKVNYIRVEKNFGGGMFTELLKPHLRKEYPVTIEEENVSGMKEGRIVDTLEPVMNQHRLIVNRRIIEADYKSTLHLPADQQNYYRLFWQMTRMVRERGAIRHDDRLDVLAQGVSYWVEQVAVDVDKAMRDLREEQEEEQRRRFLAKFKKHQDPWAKSWISMPNI